jgi:hypothetical protein
MPDNEPSAEAPLWQRQFWTDLCEKDDRTSPEEYPDMALIAQDELCSILDAAYRRGIEEAAPLIAAVIAWSEAGDRLTATKGDRLPANRAFSAAHLALHKAAKEYRALAPPREGS